MIFFFCPLYCVLVHFRRSAAGQYNISLQPWQRLSMSCIHFLPSGQTNVIWVNIKVKLTKTVLSLFFKTLKGPVKSKLFSVFVSMESVKFVLRFLLLSALFRRSDLQQAVQPFLMSRMAMIIYFCWSNGVQDHKDVLKLFNFLRLRSFIVQSWLKGSNGFSTSFSGHTITADWFVFS